MTRILALLLLLTALVAAGCGGDDEPASESGGGGEALSSEDYIDRINESQNKFVDAAGSLNLENPESPEAFAKSMETLSGNIGELSTDLEGITPPEEVADLHQQLIDGMGEYRTTIDDNVEGLRSEDSNELKTAAQNIAGASTSFSEDFGGLVTQINEKLSGS